VAALPTSSFPVPQVGIHFFYNRTVFFKVDNAVPYGFYADPHCSYFGVSHMRLLIFAILYNVSKCFKMKLSSLNYASQK
jgi:hypothetical protein